MPISEHPEKVLLLNISMTLLENFGVEASLEKYSKNILSIF